MVRGLIIRQVFIVVDCALAVAVLVMGGMIVYRVIGPSEAVSFSAEEMILGEDEVYGAPQAVKDRAHYEGIIAKRMFGDAGNWNDPKNEEEVEKEGEEGPPPPTQFNLRLLGTIALRPDDPFASAIIENQDTRVTVGYTIGQEVVEKVKLAEVLPREVYLLNERNSPATKERLSMDEVMEGEASAAPRPAMPSKSDSTDRIALNRQEFIQDLYSNYADLVTKVKPEMYRDASGKIIGVTAANIDQVPIASKLGLKNGDVLQTVNNEAIDSEQKIMEMVQKYRNANSFRIGILRNGKAKVITYGLD